jgi:hypothetical protein
MAAIPAEPLPILATAEALPRLFHGHQPAPVLEPVVQGFPLMGVPADQGKSLASPPMSLGPVEERLMAGPELPAVVLTVMVPGSVLLAAPLLAPRFFPEPGLAGVVVWSVSGVRQPVPQQLLAPVRPHPVWRQLAWCRQFRLTDMRYRP